MLGWRISIYHTDSDQSPDKYREYNEFSDECLIMTWLCGLGGRDWLDELVDQGKAEFLGGNGYPVRYRSRVKDVIASLSGGAPSGTNPLVIGEDYVMPANWSGNAEIQEQKINGCRPDDLLLIEAMDQS